MILPNDVLMIIKDFSKPHYYIGMTHPLWRHGSISAFHLRKSILWDEYQEYMDYKWRTILLNGEELTLAEYWVLHVLNHTYI